MTTPSIEELRAAWTARAATSRVGETDVRHRTALRLLADGRPVAATDIAQVSGEPVAEVEAWLARMASAGYELDERQRLVGAALTLRPTAHRIRVRGNDLYAWCGFDTLFLPILLDEPAEVSSSCPVTRQPIEIRIAADSTPTDVRPTTVVAGRTSESVPSGRMRSSIGCCVTGQVDDTSASSSSRIGRNMVSNPHQAYRSLPRTRMRWAVGRRVRAAPTSRPCSSSS